MVKTPAALVVCVLILGLCFGCAPQAAYEATQSPSPQGEQEYCTRALNKWFASTQEFEQEVRLRWREPDKDLQWRYLSEITFYYMPVAVPEGYELSGFSFAGQMLSAAYYAKESRKNINYRCYYGSGGKEALNWAAQEPGEWHENFWVQTRVMEEGEVTTFVYYEVDGYQVNADFQGGIELADIEKYCTMVRVDIKEE